MDQKTPKRHPKGPKTIAKASQRHGRKTWRDLRSPGGRLGPSFRAQLPWVLASGPRALGLRISFIYCILLSAARLHPQHPLLGCIRRDPLLGCTCSHPLLGCTRSPARILAAPAATGSFTALAVTLIYNYIPEQGCISPYLYLYVY